MCDSGWVNWLVQIEEEPLDEVEALVINRVPPSYNGWVVHRLVSIEDSPPYEDAPRYSSVVIALGFFILFHYLSLNSTFEVFLLHPFILSFQPIVMFNTSPSPCLSSYALTNVILFTHVYHYKWVYSIYNSTDEYLGKSS